MGGSVLHLAVFDAMGHDTAAGTIASAAVSACRQVAGLADTGCGVEKVLIEPFGTSRYATGILARFGVGTGRLSWVNSRRPPQVVVRDGRRAADDDLTP
ncbi:SpoIIE family protein phosphatase [Kitasatospora sp. NPDC001574]